MSESPLRARILVADAYPDAADSLATLLQFRGHQVRCAYDGRQAWEIAQEFRPHIVVLEIPLPYRDGLEVARLITAESWASKVHLIALTAMDDDFTRWRASRRGFHTFVSKPFDPPEFERRLDLIISSLASER